MASRLLSRHGWARCLVGLTVLAFGLRLYGIEFQSLWRDEMDALLFAQKSVQEHLRTFVAVGENGALFFAMLGGWVALAGGSELALRFPSLVAGTFGVPLAAVLARRLLGPGAGLVAAGLVAISPYHIWYSQEAKMYTMLAVDTTAALLALLWALDRGNWWRWAIYLLIVSVGFYIHLLSAVQVFVHLAVGAVGMWVYPKWRLHRRGFLLALGALVAPYFPLAVWQIVTVQNPPVSGYPAVTVLDAVRALTFAFSVNSAPVPSPILVFGHLFLLTSAAVPLIFGTRSVRGRWFPVVALVLAVVIPITGVLVLQLRYPLFQDRYLISSLIPYELLLAAGAASLWRQARPAAVVSLLLVLWVSGISIRWAAATPVKSDFRAAARLIEANSQPDDRVMFITPYIEETFRYYSPFGPETLTAPFIGPLPGEIVAELLNDHIDDAMNGTESIWLVRSEPETYDPQDFIATALAERATLGLTSSFARVEVRRYDLWP